MPTTMAALKHVFAGGWAPDFGPSAAAGPGRDGSVEVPWLIDPTKNIGFELDGGVHKIGGVEKLNASALESGASVRGLYDFWRYDASGVAEQRRIVHVGSTVKADGADGVFADIATGLLTDSIPWYETQDDKLIISQTGPDVPRIYDGSSVTLLDGAGDPNFAFSVTHANRQWAAGVGTAGSTLYYSAPLDPTDWTGSGSGNIAISPGDGDVITGIASFNRQLFVFKGPNRGSIHRIEGTAPTGDDPFARRDFITKGLGAVSQRSLFRWKNDLGFIWSDGSVHSILTTDRFGDFLEAALSRPFNQWARDHVNSARLDKAQAVSLDVLGCVRIALPIDSSLTNNQVLCMDFRFDPVRWAPQPMLGVRSQSLAVVRDPTDAFKPKFMGGGSDGFVRKFDVLSRSVDGSTAYDGRARTPHLKYFTGPRRGILAYAVVDCRPQGAFESEFCWIRDDNAKQTKNFLQYTGDVLAPAPTGATNFTLGTSQLAGSQAVDRALDLEEGGEFSKIAYELGDATVDHDLEVHAFTAMVGSGANVTEG